MLYLSSIGMHRSIMKLSFSVSLTACCITKKQFWTYATVGCNVISCQSCSDAVSCLFIHFNDSVRPVCSKSTGPIFAKYTQLVKLWMQLIIVFRCFNGRCRGSQFCWIIHRTEFRWYSVDGVSVRQEVHGRRWIQAAMAQPGGLTVGLCPAYSCLSTGGCLQVCFSKGLHECRISWVSSPC